MRIVAILAAVNFTLAACGGGGGGGKPASPGSMMQPPNKPVPDQIERLDFPLAGFNCLDHYGEGTDCDAYSPDGFDRDNIPTYQTDALPKRTRGDDGLHMPIYHDHSQLFGIGVHDWGDNQRRIFVGADRGESISRIPTAGTRGNTAVRHGVVSDGASSSELRSYLSESLGSSATRWETAPTVRITGSPDGQSTGDQVNWAVAAVELINAALPEDARMRIGGSSNRTIDVRFRPYTEFDAGVGGTTWNTLNGSEITGSLIHLDADAFARGSHRHFVTLIAHELLHAYGLSHVSSRFATLMASSRQIYRAWQGEASIPMPMSLLYPLDREALQVLYTELEAGDSPTAYGNWASASLHVAGNGSHANFGVAMRNDIAEPWAHGYLPDTDLADNRSLSGNAAWTGDLLGLTPDAAAVAGDARIAVNLAAMAGRADFTNLETWGANAAPGAAGTGTTWLDGDLGYSIAVRGNTFRETGGDAGRLTGIFTGAAHEGAAGTLERTDLTAAFGASR